MYSQPIHRNHSQEKRPRGVPRPPRSRGPSLYVLNVRRCDRCTRTPHRLRTRNRSSPLPGRCFLPRSPRALVHLREHTCPCPCASLRLSHDYGFFRVIFSQSRANKSPPPSSPPPRASPPRDCPILRPRAVGCLSRGHMRLSIRDELRNHTPHAIPLILATRCWLLHVCIETLGSPFSLQPRVVPYPHAAEYTRCLSLSSSLFCSQDDRDAHQLCSGEDQRPQR